MIYTNRTLIIYENKANLREITRWIQKVLGPSTAKEWGSGEYPFSDCESVAFVYSQEESNANSLSFLHNYQAVMANKKKGLFCITRGIPFLKVETAPDNLIRLFSVPQAALTDAKRMGEVQSELIQFKRWLKDSTDMPKDLLKNTIEQLLLSHNTCTLCTGYGIFVRATPIEYLYRNGCLYFVSEGGEKFIHLAMNPAVSIAIYTPYSGFNHLESVQITGNSVSVGIYSPEYYEIMKLKGIEEGKVRSLPVTLNMLKVIPSRFELLKSDLIQNGYSAKQVLEVQ